MLEERLLFTTGGADYRVADVIAAARHWGDWEVLERATGERLACLRRAAFEGDPLPRGAVEDEATRWRRARRLISGEETREWLRERKVSFGDVKRHVHGVLLAEVWSEERGATAARYAGADEEVAERLYAEGVCSGVLEGVASRLAARAAVVAAPHGEADWLARLDQRFEDFRRGLLTEAAVAKEIDSHQMDWLVVRCRLVALSQPDAAREVALSVRSDGADLSEVAERAGAAVEERRLHLQEAEPAMRERLLSAREGELIGPIEADGLHMVVLVSEKSPPSSGDAGARREAEGLLVERAMTREVASKVRWHARI